MIAGQNALMAVGLYCILWVIYRTGWAARGIKRGFAVFDPQTGIKVAPVYRRLLDMDADERAAFLSRMRDDPLIDLGAYKDRDEREEW
jgi:hypothetical protein